MCGSFEHRTSIGDRAIGSAGSQAPQDQFVASARHQRADRPITGGIPQTSSASRSTFEILSLS
jgi:hypothetical protein